VLLMLEPVSAFVAATVLVHAFR